MRTRESRLVQTFVQVADTLVADFDVIDLHTLVVDRCVEIFDVDAAGIMVVAPDGGLRVTAATSRAAMTLELFELQAGEGPCYDCSRDGKPLVNGAMADEFDRWPRFAPFAIDRGFSTAHALPMRLRDDVIGALNLFQGSGRLTQPDVDAAQGLADIATIALLNHRASIRAKLLNDQLDQALTSRIVIEQAKGVLAAKTGKTMDHAFDQLRAYARRENQRLADVAGEVVDGGLTVDDLEARQRQV